MKKLLGIIVLGLLWCNISFANNEHLHDFNQWLYQSGNHQYLNIEQKEVCKKLIQQYGVKVPKVGLVDEPKYKSMEWFSNKCHKFQATNNLKIKKNKKRNNLGSDSNPNIDTLIYYLWNYSYRQRSSMDVRTAGVELKPTKKPYEFKFNLIEDKFVKKQMKTKGILSYLYYQDGQLLIDETSPKERLGKFMNDETKYYSMSMSKSLVSYILGHAICDGYIDGVDARINDWSILNNSLYYNQKLIDLLNMSAGDQKYINEFKKNIKDAEYENKSIYKTINVVFKDSIKSESIYNYNGFVTQLILNYTKYKTGDDYDKLLNKIFIDKVKIKHSILFSILANSYEKNGNRHPNISASRHDWLRIAKAIMDDYQNDTCVGKYLKEIYKRRIPKGSKEKEEPLFNRTKSYGGQFHMDYPGLIDRVVFGMGGYGGQAILIDMENSRIVVLNSLHYNNSKFKYSVKKLLIDPIKKGK
jgi:hypothetical protein